MTRAESPGLYVHVPFCRSKCPYCDFYSTGCAPALVRDWLDGVAREAVLRENPSAVFDSLYLGGGTPSLLEPEQLSRLLDSLHLSFTFAPDTEATMEVNPDDITVEKAVSLRDFGFNRISVGAQSFNGRELLYLKRRHTAAQTEKALGWLRDAGFANIGVDLIYGFDGHTEEGWLETLDCALGFRPEHLSCYQMTIEKSTPFGRMLAQGKIDELGEEKERSFFLLTSRFLEDHGYSHYEVSNFALEGDVDRASRHNRKYWRHTPYLGLGPAAHSFDGSSRWWNPRSTRKYCRAIEEGNAPVEDSETLSADQLRLERLALGFRTKHGVALEDLEDFESSCRSESPHPAHAVETRGGSPKLRQLEQSGLLIVQNGRAVPTREGFLVADRLPLFFC